jgi:hypothetical protein
MPISGRLLASTVWLSAEFYRHVVERPVPHGLPKRQR